MVRHAATTFYFKALKYCRQQSFICGQALKYRLLIPGAFLMRTFVLSNLKLICARVR